MLRALVLFICFRLILLPTVARKANYWSSSMLESITLVDDKIYSASVTDTRILLFLPLFSILHLQIYNS